jgi:hypothetical protein
VPQEVRDMARALTPDALRVVGECLRSKRAPWSARMRAVEIALERGWGKAVQPVEVNDQRPLAGVPAEKLLAALDVLVARVKVEVER